MPPVEAFLSKLPNARKAGSGWSANCPAHDDTRASLSISEGNDGRVLVKCHAGCDTEAVCEAVGLTLRDLMPETTDAAMTFGAPRNGTSKPRGKVFPTGNAAVQCLEVKFGQRSALWTYHDGVGNPVGLVVRWDTPGGKDIRPVSLHAEGWRIGAMPGPHPLYGLPNLAGADRVLVVEGEKCADAADVLILAAEDDAARTITPRLRAAGADLGRVHIVEGVPTGDGDRPLRFPEDLRKLRDGITEHNARLVIIDPIMGFLEGHVDSHKDQSIRDVLAEIKRVAEETGAAIVMIRHLNKKAGESAMYRGGGSIAITAAARSALVVGRVPDQPDTYALAVVKCNLAPPTPAITYGIDSPESVPVISWGPEIELSADELLPATPPRQGAQRNAAKGWLTEQLGNGPILVNDLLARAKEAGHAERTIRRAADELGVDKSKERFSGRSSWSLPPKMANSPQEGKLAIFEKPSEKRVDSPKDGQPHSPQGGVGHLPGDDPAPDRVVEGEL
jgi:hypothetical protein